MCVATAVQIYYLTGSLTNPDQTWAMLAPAVAQQVALNLSVLTAVILSLRGFVVSLSTGGFGAEIRDSSHELSGGSYNNAKSSSRTNRASQQTKGTLRFGSGHSAHDAADDLRVRDSTSKGLGLRPDLSRSRAWARHEAWSEWEDRRSEGSQERIIRQTVTFHVSSDAQRETCGDSDVQTLPTGGLRATRARNMM